MGSEFSNSDLTVGNLDDFSYAMDGTEMVDQQACWKIKVTPATSNIATDYGISSKTVWISQKDFMPRKTVFMDPEGKPWKELTYSGIKMMDPKSGKYFISQMEIKNLKNGRFSKMNMTQMSFNPAVKEEYFTLSYIEKQ